MIVDIDGKEYKMWMVENMPIHVGVAIQRIKDSIEDGEEISLKHQKRILTHVLTCPLKEINKVTPEYISLLYRTLRTLQNNVSVKYSDSFYLDGKEFSVIDFDSMSVQQFADIDYFISQDVYQQLPNIINVLLRPVVNKTSESTYLNIINSKRSKSNKGVFASSNKSQILDNSDKDNTQFFKDNLPFFNAQIILSQFFKWKKEQYEAFGIIKEDNEEEVIELEEGDELIEVKSDEQSISEIWGYYHLIQQVSNGSVVERDIWLQKNIKELWKLLIYRGDLEFSQKK